MLLNANLVCFLLAQQCSLIYSHTNHGLSLLTFVSHFSFEERVTAYMVHRPAKQLKALPADTFLRVMHILNNVKAVHLVERRME